MLKNKFLRLLMASFFFAFLLWANMPATVIATQDYVIDSYNINIGINQANKINVTEVIKVNFKEQRVGIERKIPITEKAVIKYDGKELKLPQRLIIENIHVTGDEYKTEKKSGVLYIKIGDPNIKRKGPKTYVISYDIINYKDFSKQFDFVNINLINENDANIEDFSAVVTMPKGVEKKKFIVDTSYDGSSNTKRHLKLSQRFKNKGEMELQIRGKNIRKNAEITFNGTLPDNYFNNAPTFFKENLILKLIAVIFALAAGFLWFRFGRDPKLPKRTNSHPPLNMDPWEVAQRIGVKDLGRIFISEMIYLAQQGYISIAELRSATSGTDILITKTKPLKAEAPIRQKNLLNTLFYREKQVVLGELDEEAWSDIRDIMKKAQFKLAKDIIKYDVTKASKLTRILLYGLILVLAIITSMVIFSIPGVNIFNILLEIFAMELLFAGVITGHMILRKKESLSKKKYFTYGYIPVVILSIASIAALGIVTKNLMDAWLTGILVGISGVCLGFFGRYALKTTGEGAQSINKIKGLKLFIMSKEQSRLELIMREEADYPYSILPFAITFNMTDKWIAKFSQLEVSRPEWYSPGKPWSEPKFNLILRIINIFDDIVNLKYEE